MMNIIKKYNKNYTQYDDRICLIYNIKIKNKNILIFDDIYTTGATANECAKVINEELAPNKIGILTMAKD